MNPSSEREQVRENGPFTAENWRGEIVVQSEDFHHDVTLKISGDFGDPGVKLAYAQHLAEILNLGIASRAARPTQPQQAGVKESLTTDQAIELLVTALAESKGWMRGYSDSIIRDAIDRSYLMVPQQAVWISIQERLPELDVSVALINVDRFENTGGDLEMNVRACGYLSDMGYTKYWSIRGERATNLHAFTHWMPLPPPPAIEERQP